MDHAEIVLKSYEIDWGKPWRLHAYNWFTDESVSVSLHVRETRIQMKGGGGGNTKHD